MRPQSRRPGRWFERPSAAAYGQLWDVWVVNVDGSGLQRLTTLEELSYVPTWSPNGAWIVPHGEHGLSIIHLERRSVWWLAEAQPGQ